MRIWVERLRVWGGAGWRVAALTAVAVGAIWAMALIVREMRISSWRGELIDGGFPADYAQKLAELKFRHPKWCFEPLRVDDLTWSDVVEKECTAGWNLVACTTWAPTGWERLGSANYTPYYAANARAYDSGAWYQASREAIAYFMDPRNFFNEADIFMFESLDYDAESQTQELVESVLAQTFMANACYDGGDRRFSELLVDIGRRRGISPVFLAGRLSSEQGTGSVQARGVIGDSLFELSTNRIGKVGNSLVWGQTYTFGGKKTAAVLAKGRAAYNGYYNFFNIGAFGMGLFEIRYNAWREAVSAETTAKYLGPWKTQARAIEGGAIRIKERYIDTCRHTRYLQKFSVSPGAGVFRWKQYMQNIGAPLSESRKTSAAYDAVDSLDRPCRFVIPVYRNMPAAPSADPAKGRSAYSPTRS